MYLYVMVIVLIIRIITTILKRAKTGFVRKRKPAAIKIRNAEGVLANNFIDTKNLYVKLNRQLPNVMLVNRIQADDAYKLIKEMCSGSIIKVYQHNQFNHEMQEAFFNMTILVLSKKRVVEIGNGYVELLYSGDQFFWANNLAKELSVFRFQTEAKLSTANIYITGFAGANN